MKLKRNSSSCHQALPRVKYVPVNYAMRFSGPVTALTARPDGHGAGASQSASPMGPGIKTCASPAAFPTNPFFLLSLSTVLGGPRRASGLDGLHLPLQTRVPLPKGYDAASEKNAALSPPALGPATVPPTISPRPSNRGPTPESDVDAVPDPSRSPATRSRDGLRCSVSPPPSTQSPARNRSHDPPSRDRRRRVSTLTGCLTTASQHCRSPRRLGQERGLRSAHVGSCDQANGDKAAYSTSAC